MIKRIEAFTDGSSTVYKNAKNMRYGGSGVYFPNNTKHNISQFLIGPEVTNNRAELLACILAIKNVIKRMKKNKQKWALKLYVDSKYSINCATVWSKEWILYGWKRKSNGKFTTPCNIDLIKELYKLSCMYPITYQHVKGHKKEPKDKKSEEWYLWNGNNEADRLARTSMEEIKKNDNIKDCSNNIVKK